MLEVQNITIGYGAAEIVKNVSFSLRENETLAIVGANGAGKTTLLKSLNASLPLRTGEIFLDGKKLQDYSRRQIAQKIAVVAQETETKFPVSVSEFVLAGRFAHGGTFGWETENDLAISARVLETCDLKKFANRLMNELSGGERQRVLFARALATEAKILLLDEPTANLDFAHQALMFRLVRERCKSCNAAAVIITHDLNLASEFADEILLLKNGETVAKGKPKEVLNAKNLREVFAVEVLLDAHPASGKPRLTMTYDK
ncbi:MAG: ABC transporter ATP-binding protein [Acidobacteriota bacterium]|nr:ABC transporter ATP-binding protein [Acidobacteriota bacterium]